MTGFVRTLRPVQLLWLLPTLLSAVLASSSGLGVAAQDAASATATPTPTHGLVPGPGQPVGDSLGLGSDVLGRGAVRRTFTAPADGWYRLVAKGTGTRWAVTVLDGRSRSVLASNRWEDHLEGGALIHARAGADLAVLVGALDGSFGGFDLEWARAPAPVRLRPVGRLADGGRDARGTPVEMRRLGDLAFGAGRLFLASGLGLSAYARDPATGGLVLERLVDADVARALLAWDEGRSRLLAHDCGSWTAFAVRADGALGPAQAVAAAGDPAHCGPPLIDAEGGLVLRAAAGGLDLFSVGESSGLRYEGAVPVPGLEGAALAEGGRAYAVAGDELLVIGWADGQRLATAPTGVRLATPSLGRVPLAVDAGRGLLLAADAEGARLFALGEGTAPAPLDILPLPAGDGEEASGCAFAALRPGGVVDALCGGRLFTGQWLGDSLAMAAAPGDLPTPATRTDTPTNAALDDLGEAVGMAATPDGRRVYVSTPEDGILTFERVPGEGSNSTADDHGDDPATATVVAIPSTTAGELGAGDRDYFRIDIIRAGILTFETTGSTDTYGTLYDSDGNVLEEDDDRGPRPTNFGISDVLLFEGTYFLEVREVRGVTGAYELRVTGDARSPVTPAATAPSVSIDAIPSGNEGTDVRLGATLTGGAYDGAADYAWSVDGGTLDDDSAAAPTWTRPAVTSNANHTASLTVTVRGTGTNAEDGTSDTANASREALVRDVPPPLPAADAPSVTVNAIPDGSEGTTARLGATLTGGTYDGSAEFAWTVTGGRLSNPNSATPTWTRPAVDADADFTVRLAVTVRGRGANARSGTSERADADRTARVLDVPAQLPPAAAPSVSINAIAVGDEGTTVQLGAAFVGGTYDGAVGYQWSVDGGLLDNPAAATPTWTRPSVSSNTNYTVRLTVTARGSGTAARNGTSDTANASRAAQVLDVAVVLPAAAPSVSIDPIPAGDEGTNVQLAATLNGGTYDGAVDYAWTVTGGTLDDPAAATPTWTRPSVTSNANHTVRLTVTARGSGTVARSGTSDTASGSRVAQVRNVVVLPVAAAPSVTIDAIPAGNENVAVQLGAALAGGTYEGGGVRLERGRRDARRRRRRGADLDPPVGDARRRRRRGADLDPPVGDVGHEPHREPHRHRARQRHGRAQRHQRHREHQPDGPGAGRRRPRQRPGVRHHGGHPLDHRRDADARRPGPLPHRGRPGRVAAAGDRERHGHLRHALRQRRVADHAQRRRRQQLQLPHLQGLHRRRRVLPAGARLPAIGHRRLQPRGVGHRARPDGIAGGRAGGVDRLDHRRDADARRPGPLPHRGRPGRVAAAGDRERHGHLRHALRQRRVADHAQRRRRQQLQLPHLQGLHRRRRVLPAFRPGTRAPRCSTTVGATLAGGTYDGAVEYDWSVSGGTLDNANLAAPTWTRPAVNADASHTVSLTVSVDGTGTNARNGTSDTANTSRDALVRNVVAQLPPAAAPSVAINRVATGDERTDVQLGATLNGGTHDGAVDYAWSVNGGTLDNASAAAPTWTRPSVTSDTSYTASLTVTVGGSGTNARNGTSDTASTSRDALVRNVVAQLPPAAAPSVSINRVATGDERTTVRLGATLNGGTYDGAAEYAWRVDDGTLDDPTSATPIWTRPRVATNLNFIVRVTVTVRGAGTAARNGTSDTAHTTHSAHVRNVGGDTHGNDWASATVVAIPSTTGGELSPGDKDYFRIDIAQAGSLTLRTTGRVDTYGALYRSYGALIAKENNVGTDINFILYMESLDAGSYYLEVRGNLPTSQGGYELEVSGTARGPEVLPVAGAPSVSINAIPPGDEGAAVQLGATLNGGTYDPPLEYSWSVDSGVLDNANAATPTWTRPSVTSSANHDVRLTVRVRGYGTTTRNGTSASASASSQALVRNVASQLPLAAAPAVSINAIPAGGERAAVQLGATLTGGAYDDAEYAWSVDGGTLDNANVAAPTWTRPSVQANANHTVRLKVRVRGAGTAARSGTGATASASRSAQVQNVVQDDHGDGRASATPVQIGSTVAGALGLGDRDYFRIDIGQAGTLTLATSGSTDTFGTLQDSGGTRIAQDDESGPNHNFSISTGSLNVGTYYLEVRGWNRMVSGSYRLSVSGSARGQTGLPPVTAPSVTIDYIPAGDEHTAVQLGATLTGGTYDGTPEYEWRVSGALNDATAATPTLRRPEVGSNTTATATLIVTVRGAGTNARSGSSVSVSASRPYLVRPVGVAVTRDDHGDSRVAATPLPMRGRVAGDLGTRGDKDFFWFHLPSLAEVVVQTSGHTDTVGTLFGLNGGVIESNGSGGRRQNFKISRVLEAGHYFVEVKGYTAATIGRYEVSLTPPPVPRPPTLVSSAMPTAQSATAGGASLDFYLENAFVDPDGDYVWLDPSSDNEAVATVALDGPALVVQPLAAGTATITVTARDPSGLSVAGSFTVNVGAPTTADPTGAFNAAGDQLTLSFTDQFAPGETRAYRAAVRQKSPRDGWSTFCIPANSTGNGTQSVAIDLPMTGIAEPGVVYEAVYRHIGSSCTDTGSDRWSRVVEATAPGTASFDIELVFVGSPEAAYRTAVEEAAQYWERILTMSLPDYDFSSDPLSGEYCESGAPELNDVVDDLRLFVAVTSIDGEGGTLASAGPCYLREESGLPIAAGTTIDVDDLRESTAAEIREVIVHEIGHALGFNRANWRPVNLMRNPSLDAQGRIVAGVPDAHFVGPRAVAAFNAAGGSSYANGKVPLENIRGGRGSQDSHWRESVMGNELMTPFSNHGGEPLSAISIQAMADMGYHVDVSQAESYELPSAGQSFSGSMQLKNASSDSHEHSDTETIPLRCVVRDNPVTIGGSREVVLTPTAVRTTPVGVQ